MLEGGSGNRIQHFVSPVFLRKITRQSLRSRGRSPLYSQQHPCLRKMKKPRFGRRVIVLLQQRASYLVEIYHLSKGAEGFMWASRCFIKMLVFKNISSWSLIVQVDTGDLCAAACESIESCRRVPWFRTEFDMLMINVFFAQVLHVASRILRR